LTKNNTSIIFARYKILATAKWGILTKELVIG